MISLLARILFFLLTATIVQSAYDLNVARTICNVGNRRGVTARVMLASFETAIVESGCRNLNYGDRDSVGVFQQRPSQGWGTREQCMNVDYAANKFFEVCQTRDICGPTAGNLAQCVQRSAYPDRYDQNEGNARSLMAQIGCSAGGGGGGGAKNEAPCSDVGNCYNRDTEKCNGSPQEKVNGKFACPSQPNNVICCVRNNGIKNESPCSSVGVCYDRNTGSCPAERQMEKVNGAWACPSQPNNIICCKN